MLNLAKMKLFLMCLSYPHLYSTVSLQFFCLVDAKLLLRWSWMKVFFSASSYRHLDWRRKRKKQVGEGKKSYHLKEGNNDEIIIIND